MPLRKQNKFNVNKKTLKLSHKKMGLRNQPEPQYTYSIKLSLQIRDILMIIMVMPHIMVLMIIIMFVAVHTDNTSRGC